MRKSKLVLLLKKLDEKEWMELGKFLKSPFYNSNKKVIALYQYLRKYYPEFPAVSINKEKVYFKIFSGQKKYDYRQFANLMTELYNLTESFLVALSLRQNKRLEQKILIDVYEKNNYGAFTKKIKKVLSAIEDNPAKGYQEYYDKLQLTYKLYYHPQLEKNTSDVPALKKCVKCLDELYIYLKLQLACEIESRKLFLTESTPITLLKEVCDLGLMNNQMPAVQIYLSFLDLLKQKTLTQYYITKKHFFEKLVFLPKDQQRNLFPILINVTNKLSYEGNTAIFQEQFDLFKKALNLDLLIENNYMPSPYFSNVVTIGLVLKEFDWTQKFILNHQQYLEKEGREIIVLYCKARLLVEQKAYTDANQILQQAMIINHVFGYKVRYLSLRCLYEIYSDDDSYFDALQSGIEAFEKYIQRNKQYTKARALPYSNFCKFIKLMLNKNKCSPNELQKIKDELQSQPVFSRAWLLSCFS